MNTWDEITERLPEERHSLWEGLVKIDTVRETGARFVENLTRVPVITNPYLTEAITPTLTKRIRTWDGREVKKVYRLPSRTTPSSQVIYDIIRNVIICHPIMLDQLRTAVATGE